MKMLIAKKLNQAHIKAFIYIFSIQYAVYSIQYI